MAIQGVSRTAWRLESRCWASMAMNCWVLFMVLDCMQDVLFFLSTLCLFMVAPVTREEYLQLLVERAPYHRKTLWMYVATAAILMVACIAILVIIIMSCS